MYICIHLIVCKFICIIPYIFTIVYTVLGLAYERHRTRVRTPFAKARYPKKLVSGTPPCCGKHGCSVVNIGAL